jgi:membrane-bound lytic murein transglycosylase F
MIIFVQKQRMKVIRGILAITAGLFFTTVCLAPFSVGKDLKSVEELAYEKSAGEASALLSSLRATEYFELISRYSAEYGVDYRLILALINQESRFIHESLSEKGAMGLMQIMPSTSSDLSAELAIENITLPHENLRAGIYYLSTLIELFRSAPESERIQLALAAYNAGPSRIYDAQELAAYMGENPNSWASVRSALPMLSKRFYSLHESVWPDGKPKNGSFGSWKQTVRYVDTIMMTYDAYVRAVG